MDRLAGILGLPESAHLGKRLFKKHFIENGILTPGDKKSLQDDVESIIWQYTLKPSTVQIRPYVDGEREYLEMAVLEVLLRSPKNYKRLAEVIHREIPYPLLVVFSQIEDMDIQDSEMEDGFTTNCTNSGSMIALSVAPKRFSMAERGAIVAEDFFTTGWIDLNSLTEIEKIFLENMDIKSFPHTDFFAFYSVLIDRFIALDCASFRGVFRLDSKLDPEMRGDQVAQCHELEGRIAVLRKKLRSETQFNNQVELNVNIKRLEKELQEKSTLL